MELQRFCLKFFARHGQQTVSETTFIPIFHDWIRLKTIPGTLIDVADYRHVPEGPGIMLISHETNYAMDHGGGHFGLSAQRKLGAGASHTERIHELARRLARFGSLLEADDRLDGALSLEGGGFLYVANDRLRAPNTQEAFDAIQPDVEAAAHQLYGSLPVAIARVVNDPRDRLALRVETSQPVAIADLAG